MPTPEELKKIAREYALKNCSALVPAGRIDFIANDFIEHLSKDYCIVPKSKLKDEYEFWRQRLPKNCNLASEVNNNPDTARMWGKIEALNDLFGTELFNEENDV